MRIWKSRLTLGRMMAVIAIVALGIAMSRRGSATAVSLCVFAGCTWYLAARRYAEALARRTAVGTPVGPSEKVRIAARCTIVAALAIGLPDAAFLGGFYGYMAVTRSGIVEPDFLHGGENLAPVDILGGAIVGVAAALYVAAFMRRGWRPAVKKRAMVRDRTPTHTRIEHARVAVRRVPAW